MEIHNLYFIDCGRCGTGKSSDLIASFVKNLKEIYLIWIEEIERELEEALRRDLARKTVCFVQHPDASPICSRTICRIDEEIRVEKEKRYASKSFVYNNISAFKNLHAEGQVRSLIPLKKETSFKGFANEKRLHRPNLLLLCKKRVLRSSVKKKQIWKCKSNSTLKNLYYKWKSVLQIWLSCRDRRDQEYLFEY